MTADADRPGRFPIGTQVTLRQLDEDPHPVLARLRASEPVSWVPCLDGWLVTRHDLVLAAMRDARTFTVDDPRFSTAQVVGPSMLSLDGDPHARHRQPFVGPFRAVEVSGRFERAANAMAAELVQRLAPQGAGDLRHGLSGPMGAGMMALALGLKLNEVDALLHWYEAIVAAVTAITAGEPATGAGADAFDALADRLRRAMAGGSARVGKREAGPAEGGGGPEGGSLLAAAADAGGLDADEIVSNAAVLLFGGIETTDGMIANAVLHLLEHPELAGAARADPARLDAVIDESLRLEPAAAVIDRYATADTDLGGAAIRRGDLVRISLAAANRDPAVFPHPHICDAGRPNLRRHVAFAQGPHVCVGVHLARLETRAALGALLAGLPHLRPDPERPAQVRGLVFRKPRTLHARWADAHGVTKR